VGNRSETADGYWFAYDVERGTLRDLLIGGHSRHLLFLPVFRGLYDALHWAGVHVSAYDEIRLVSAVVAAATVPIMALVLERRLRLSRFAAVAGAMGLAVSHGFWRYANEAKVYPVAILFVLLLCWMGFDQRQSLRSAVLGGAIATLGILFVAEVASALVAICVAFLLRRQFRLLGVYLMTILLLFLAATLLLYGYLDPPGQRYTQYVLTSAK
jgi:hypothetical protein